MLLLILTSSCPLLRGRGPNRKHRITAKKGREPTTRQHVPGPQSLCSLGETGKVSTDEVVSPVHCRSPMFSLSLSGHLCVSLSLSPSLYLSLFNLTIGHTAVVHHVESRLVSCTLLTRNRQNFPSLKLPDD